MKRFIATLILPAAAVLCLAVPSRALTLSAGPVAWYAWWNPVFQDGITTARTNLFGPTITFPTFNKKFSMDPAFLYGPMLSLSQGSWTVSSVYTTGKYHAEARGVWMTMGIPPVTTFHTDNNIRKHDLDTAVNYSLTDYMKLYFGFKYQRYGYQLSSTAMVITTKTELDFNGYSAGLGLAFTLPIAGNFYLLSTVSGLYMLTDVFFKRGMAGVGLPYLPSSGREQVHCLGVNLLLSVAYHVEPLSTTLSVGVRYQYIKFLDADTFDVQNATLSGRDQFCGIFFSAVYSFEL